MERFWGSYSWAQANGFLNDVRAHWNSGNESWTIEKAEQAFIDGGYTSRSDFMFGNQKACLAAIRLGILPCLIDSAKGRWDIKANVIAEAGMYMTRAAFSFGSGGAYEACRRNGWLDDPEVTGHMEDAVGGFDSSKPGYVYVIKFDVPGFGTVWKVGITNLTAERRARGFGVLGGATYEVIGEMFFEIGRDALTLEQCVHRELSAHAYCGPRFIENGYTELFTVDPLDLLRRLYGAAANDAQMEMAA